MKAKKYNSRSLGEAWEGLRYADLTATAATIDENALLVFDGNAVKESTDDSAAVAGVAQQAVAASEGVRVGFGGCYVRMASPVALGAPLVSRAGGYAAQKITAQTTILSATAGGNFGNQPANDGVEVVSDSTADTTQTVTLYGILDGETTITTSTVELNGTTAVADANTDWSVIVGVELDAVAAGTVTIREASADQAITTITTGNLVAGIVDATTTQAFGIVPNHDASGASTAQVALFGTDVDGNEQYSADALNGATEEAHGTASFGTVTKIFLGAVASTVDVTILSAAADTNTCGRALEALTAPGVGYANIPMNV